MVFFQLPIDANDPALRRDGSDDPDDPDDVFYYAVMQDPEGNEFCVS